MIRRADRGATPAPSRSCPPAGVLASLGYVFTQQTALLLRVTLITMAIGLGYWLAVILPQRGRAWHLFDAAVGGPLAPESAYAA
jgi:hypothetical protein